jgi:hypothetical protein
MPLSRRSQADRVKLILENWREYQLKEDLLSDPVYVSNVLGVDLPLNESYPYSTTLTEEILSEQLLLEGWIDSVKDFAKGKSKPYRDFLVTLTGVIKDPEKLKSFLYIVDKNMRREIIGTTRSALELLQNFGIPGILEGFQKLLDAYDAMKMSWKKGLIATTMYTVFSKIKQTLDALNIKSLFDAVKGKNMEEIKSILADFPAFQKIKDFLIEKVKAFIGPELLKMAASKITDIKTYLGWLGPVVGGVDIVIKAMAPMTSKAQG